MIVYATLIGLASDWAAWVTGARRWPLIEFGPSLAWGIWLAVLFDVTENVAVLVQRIGWVPDPYPEIAALCATCKITLIAALLVYAAYGVAAWVTGRRWVEARG